MRLYLLRHGEVASHRGDVPITPRAGQQAYEVGLALARIEPGTLRILSGETRRALETARQLAKGAVDAGSRAQGPDVAFALRNPDIYLSGVRVNMVSSAAAFAEQVEGATSAEVESLSFFPEFIASTDRIGWWLGLASPPGENAAAIASRVRSFASSLLDPVSTRTEVVVAVTHSPVIRAAGLDLLGRDIGEPPWVSGLLITVDGDGSIHGETFAVESQ